MAARKNTNKADNLKNQPSIEKNIDKKEKQLYNVSMKTNWINPETGKVFKVNGVYSVSEDLYIIMRKYNLI